MPYSHQAEKFQGLNAHRLQLSCGDEVLVAEQGAQVLSWRSMRTSPNDATCASKAPNSPEHDLNAAKHHDGREGLYLSPRNDWAALSAAQAHGSHGWGPAIRGGIPVCFPQFNQRGPAKTLPKHGFARNLAWRFVSASALDTDGAQLLFELRNSPATLALWPHAFAAQLQVLLQPDQLHLTLTLHNIGSEAWAFSGALHTYLAVPEIQQVSLSGLQGQTEWDALTDCTRVVSETLHFGPRFDRVYSRDADQASNPSPLRLNMGNGQTLAIEQSPSWGHTVVWNPGPELGVELADLPDDGHRHMLCVEAAQVFGPIELAANAHWHGTQSLRWL